MDEGVTLTYGVAADTLLLGRESAGAPPDVHAAADARVNVALASDTPFAERLVHFWANHFAPLCPFWSFFSDLTPSNN